MLVMGIDPTQDEAVRDYDLKEGAFFREKYDALLETGFAHGLGVKRGRRSEAGRLPRRAPRSIKKFKITGLLSPRGAAGFNQGGVIFLSLKTAEPCSPSRETSTRSASCWPKRPTKRRVAAEIAKLLPTGLSVRSPMARSQLAKETVQDAEKGLDFAYALMIVLAVFTIFNTFLMNVGERRRQLAVLRAIGATRRQIMRMLLLEGLAMGLVGTVLGSLVGLGRGVWLDAGDGPGVWHDHAGPAHHPRPVHRGRLPWPGHLAVGHVHSRPHRRQDLAAGRDAVHRLRSAPPRHPGGTSVLA